MGRLTLLAILASFSSACGSSPSSLGGHHGSVRGRDEPVSEAEDVRAAEDGWRSEEAQGAEEEEMAQEARNAEQARREQEARNAEQARREQEARNAEQARREQEARREKERMQGLASHLVVKFHHVRAFETEDNPPPTGNGDEPFLMLATSRTDRKAETRRIDIEPWPLKYGESRSGGPVLFNSKVSYGEVVVFQIAFFDEDGCGKNDFPIARATEYFGCAVGAVVGKGDPARASAGCHFGKGVGEINSWLLDGC